MAYDVAARLAEGRPALADFESFAMAAHAVGYQNPNLTTHSAQIRDLYGAEDGMDLPALASDADALSHLASLAREALDAQAAAMGELVGAWQGQAADAAREFLRRHQDSATAVSAAVQKASGALSALRDQLWHAVDAKVDATRAIDDRCASARAEWLAASHAVLAGGGDRAVASELVDLKVRPFVEADIGSDWVSAMRTSTDSVKTAYETAVGAVKPDQLVSFEVPGHLGPAAQPALGVATAPVVGLRDVPPTIAPSSVQPAAAQTAPAAAPPPAPPLTPLAPLPAAEPALPTASQAAPAAPGLGDLGGMPAMGSGLSGLGRQLTDGIAGLTGSAQDALPDDPADELDDEGLTDEEEGEAEEEKDDEEVDDEEDEEGEDDDQAGEEGDADAIADPADPDGLNSADGLPTPPVPTPSAEPLATDLRPRPEPPARTPCEIAADEVPQVGE